MREEYQAILDAGLLLQIDFPMLVSRWDTASRTMSLAEYRKWAEERIAYLNHALRGLPEDRIRFHTCYGVNFGPRVSDLQLENLIDLIFTIKAGAYSFEAANPRHEHEWRVLEKVKLPNGKILIPGAVTHSNVMIEHPEVVVTPRPLARIVAREPGLRPQRASSRLRATPKSLHRRVSKLWALGEGAHASASLRGSRHPKFEPSTPPTRRPPADRTLPKKPHRRWYLLSLNRRPTHTGTGVQSCLQR
jgi:5-methyltetrahydropteroyltriglutamate--homocysteine methyltransferase